MKKYRILISIIGFILQIVLFMFFAIRIGYWSNVSLYYIIFSIFLLLYNLVIYTKPTLKGYSVLHFFGIISAALLSGFISGFELLALIWLLLVGVITGSLVAALLYHFIHLFIPGGLEENGFNLLTEVVFTFFAFASYPMLLYIPITLVSAVILGVIILAVSFLVGLALTIPLVKSIEVLAKAIEGWQSIDALPAIRITIMNKVHSILDNFLKQVRESFVTLTDMGNEIKTTAEDLSSVSEQMNASLQEVSSAIQQISKGAQEQSTSITSTARSIEELNSLTSSISSQVKMASVSSRRTTDSAKHGMELSKNEAKISKEIFEQTKFVEDKMGELRDQSIEIKKIFYIISGVTEQTDLLALNAAIEAARVGEKGRGFAVVADEIRNLANETQRSSSVVESLISEISKTIEELSALLKSEREKMTESNRLAAETEEQFTGIVKAVDLVTDMISRINQAATSQAQNTKELVKQVEQIAQVAANTASSTEEVSASVQEQTASMQEFTSTAQILSSFAQKLDDLLSKIRK